MFLICYQFTLCITLASLFDLQETYFGLFAPQLSFEIGYQNIFRSYSQYNFVFSQIIQLACALIHFILIVILEEQDIRNQIPSHQSNQAISVKDIGLEINKKKILSNISFSVKKKQIFGLIGHHGAGETSFFNIISRQIKPTQGQVTINNEKTDLGLVPSFSPLHEDLNFIEHLKIYGLLKGMNKLQISHFLSNYCLIMNLQKASKKMVKFFKWRGKKKGRAWNCFDWRIKYIING